MSRDETHAHPPSAGRSEEGSIRRAGPIRWRVLILCLVGLPILGGILFHFGPSGGGGHANMALHAVLEAQGGLACLALAVLMLFLAAPKDDAGRDANLIIASGLVLGGVLDSFHAVSSPGNAFVWLRTCSTFGGGLMIAALWRPFRHRVWGGLPWAALAAGLLIGAGSLSMPGILPEMVRGGAFSPSAMAMNIVGGIGYLAGVVHMMRRMKKDRESPILLMATFCFFGSAGLLFSMSGLWSSDWWWWHLVRYAASLAMFIQFARYARALHAKTMADRDSMEAAVRQRTLALREAMEKAEAANRAKSAFLAAMSHEIRTPMNAVLNMIAAVLEAPLGGEQRGYLQVADSSARHLLSVINDILDFSKIESGKLEIEDIPFSLHGLLESVADLFRSKVAQSRVELVLDIAPGTPDGIRGDPTRLRQVLVNLVGNAFKFTAKGQIVLHARAEGGRLRLAVVDSGIGIPQDQQDRLFRPFVQADAATTRRFGGTGLGLTISQRLAQLMGGDITLSSVVGEGSLFTVCVPLRTDAAGDRGELRLPLSLEGRGVLLIEDNAASREAMRVMFERHGLKCVSFAAVEPAIAWLKSPAASDVGAAVVDWSLAEGGLDGLAGIGELRRIRAGLPCFLISAFAGREVQERARSSGAAAFIPKPVTWGAVHAALQRAMDTAFPVPAPASAVAEPFAGMLALLAEDNPQNQLVARVLLKKLGIAVEVAGDGKAALEMARANPGKYRIILMDMQMPEMDGLESTRRIRALGAQIPDLKTIPIVAMTANAMKSDLDACLEAGMDGFVTKPIDKAVLAAELGRVLGKDGT